MTIANQQIYQRAIDTWGRPAQIEMIIEECSELIHALQKLKRNRTPQAIEHVWEEVADVTIMIEQASVIFDNDQIERIKAEKIKRLLIRLNK